MENLELNDTGITNVYSGNYGGHNFTVYYKGGNFEISTLFCGELLFIEEEDRLYKVLSRRFKLEELRDKLLGAQMKEAAHSCGNAACDE